MLKILTVLFCLFASVANAQMNAFQMHCGYDFTSYIVVFPHEDGKEQIIDGLRITISTKGGKDVINVNNSLSWSNANKPMVFTRNYKIDDKNNKVSIDDMNAKWFYYFAQNHYLLSVSNTFPADNFFLKIEDIDGEENGGHFQTQIIPLASYNMYILCSSEERTKVVQFGRKMNKPIDVVMEKIK